MASVTLQGLRKRFPNGFEAMRGLDLEIADGEFMVLVGPSGCGKSTLLRLIAGLEQATAGTVLIGDRDVTEAAPAARDIAMVFQSYALYPHMAVADNLAFGLRRQRTPRQIIPEQGRPASRARSPCASCSTDGPGMLSGGQRQRVAIGRAMVREPVVYLMDEPLSNLDAKLRVSMRAELARLHDRLGVTTVYVTHDQIEAMTLGDRVCVLLDGEVQQVDTPDRLFGRPANTFVASFIGSPSMNLAIADVEGEHLRFGQYGSPCRPRAGPGARWSRVVVGLRPCGLPASGRRFRPRGRPAGPGRAAVDHGRGGRASRRPSSSSCSRSPCRGPRPGRGPTDAGPSRATTRPCSPSQPRAASPPGSTCAGDRARPAAGRLCRHGARVPVRRGHGRDARRAGRRPAVAARPRVPELQAAAPAG